MSKDVDGAFSDVITVSSIFLFFFFLAEAEVHKEKLLQGTEIWGFRNEKRDGWSVEDPVFLIMWGGQWSIEKEKIYCKLIKKSTMVNI